MNRGKQFEKYVTNLVTRLGYTNVKHDVRHSTNSTSCQIDVEYGMLCWKRYIECKYRQDSTVSLPAVSKFAAALDLIGAWQQQGIVVTNTTFSKRAQEYARSKGMELHDGASLKKLDDRCRDDERTLEERIREVQP